MNQHSTNPAYLELAYRRAIVRHVANFLINRFVGKTGQAPAEVIVSDEVFREDSEVPSQFVLAYAEELRDLEGVLALELGKFEFRRKEDRPPAERPRVLPRTPVKQAVQQKGKA